MPEEVLVPGALYADCAVVVKLAVKMDIQTSGVETSMNEETKGHKGDVIELPDDGEYGGELAGRLVWEAYEAGLKNWERENPRPLEDDGVEDRENKSGGMDTGKQKNKEDEVEEDVYL